MNLRTCVLLVAAALGTPALADGDCAPDRLDIRGDFGTARFTVEVADDAKERGQGLMFRESMATGAGMLFVYERPQHATFWMRNTPLPLDMIFAGPDGVVTRVHENAVPFDETTIDGGEGVQFVLEINGGLARLLGIGEGDELRHPSIEDPSWPCE